MYLGILFGFIVFLVLLAFYAINSYRPQKRKIKYLISLCFFIVGSMGWLYVWFGKGWLLTSIVSSGFLLLAAFSFIIAFGLDFAADKRSNHLK